MWDVGLVHSYGNEDCRIEVSNDEVGRIESQMKLQLERTHGRLESVGQRLRI